MRDGENINVEFKECGKACPKELWPTYSAFANTHGGWIILGVKEYLDRPLPNRFEAAGVINVEKVKQDIGSILDNPQKVNRNLLTDRDIFPIRVDGKDLLVIHVPEADYRQKPIYLYGNKVNHSYKRTYQGDAHLSDEELAMMLRDADTGDNDLALMEHYGMQHIDDDALRKYRQLFNLKNEGHVFSTLESKDFLMQMGGYIIQEETGKEGLTLAGLLMFGKGLAIRNRFPNLRMDYLDLSNIPAGSNIKWNERLTYDGRWENNLFNFITYVMNKITFGIPAVGIVIGTTREDDTPVNRALREGVTNSVIHSDFRVEGVLRIDKTEKEIIIRNPGVLKLSREKIYRGKHSKARNPKIQDMLRMIGYGDNIGSGFPQILKAWADESWLQPELNEDRESLEISLTLSMTSLFAPSVLHDVQALYGDDFADLTHDEKKVICLLVSGRGDSNSALQPLIGKNGWEVNRLLSGLVSKSFLRSIPNGRWTTYELNTEYLNKHASKQQEQSEERTKERTKEQIKERIKEHTNLSVPQKTVLLLMVEHSEYSLKEFSTQVGITEMAIRYLIKKVKSWLEISHNGPNKGGKWIVQLKNR